MLKSFFSPLPRYFALLFIVCFAVSFFALYESFREYRAEATVLVLSKSPAISAETVAHNISELSRTIGFYDRLLADHSNITDPWQGKSSFDRREAWNGVLFSSVLPETSLVRFSVSSGNGLQSVALLNASLETLYGFSGRLYDHEEEVGVRLVDDVAVEPAVSGLWALVSVSALCAAIFAFLLSLLLQMSSRAMSNPAISSLRTAMLSKGSWRASESLRPVGSFPDLPVDVPEKDLAPETVKSLTDASSNVQKGSSVEKEGASPMIVPEAEPDPIVKNTTSNKGDSSVIDMASSATLSEKNAPDEPRDIWEKTLSVSVGKSNMGANLPEALVSEKKTIAEDPTKLTIFSEGNNVRHAVHTPSSFAGSEVSAPNRPGNLESIPASDFSWEKYLFQHAESKKENESVEVKEEAPLAKPPVPEKREPTPQELKARLNQLLLGEL